MAYLGRRGALAPVTSADIPDNSITAAKIVEGTITVGDIGTDAVGTDEIATGAVDTAELADDAVTAAKLADSINTAIAANTAKVSFTPDAAQVFNDTGADVDFRVEGVGSANALFVQGSDGNVGIGTATPLTKLHLEVTDNNSSYNAAQNLLTLRNTQDSDNNQVQLAFMTAQASYVGGYIGCKFLNTGSAYGNLIFGTGANNTMTERMRITHDGKVGIGSTNPDTPFYVEKAAGSQWVANIINSSTSSPYGIRIRVDAADNNTVTSFLGCGDTSQYRLRIYSNGTVQNVDGTYGSSLSDERLKTDIHDANSQWEDVKNINIVNYKRLVDGEDSKSMLSVIAQQVKAVSPKLVGERPPEINEIEVNPIFGTLYKEADDIPEGKKIGDIKEIKEKVLFFKDSIFFWKCAKALQEAMAKIETLETKVTALESA